MVHAFKQVNPHAVKTRTAIKQEFTC